MNLKHFHSQYQLTLRKINTTIMRIGIFNCRIKNFLIFILCGCFLLTFSFFSSNITAQTLTDLEKQRSNKEKEKVKLQQEIELANAMLVETNKTKTISLNQLELLDRQISMRIKLISILNSEINILNKQILEIHSIIQSLNKDLIKLKDEYAKMIYFTYKNRSAHNKLMFLFASENFQQAYKRIKYLQQYSSYRKTQAEIIEETSKMLSHKAVEVEFKKKKQNQLLVAEEQQKLTLKNEKVDKIKLLENLKTKEKHLKSELKDKQKAADRLTKAIEDIIRKEIEARKKNDIKLTPEALKLSASFESNKGMLPWPVEKGIITGIFGKQEHSILKGIYINNNGIDIKTNKGEKVRSVFDGEITGVVSIPGAQIAVIVRHGEFLSVYSNLKEVFVKKGDKVKTKQVIGLTYTDEKDNNTELHFEVWKNTDKMDPSVWIFLPPATP